MYCLQDSYLFRQLFAPLQLYLSVFRTEHATTAVLPLALEEFACMYQLPSIMNAACLCGTDDGMLQLFGHLSPISVRCSHASKRSSLISEAPTSAWGLDMRSSTHGRAVGSAIAYRCLHVCTVSKTRVYVWWSTAIGKFFFQQTV